MLIQKVPVLVLCCIGVCSIAAVDKKTEPQNFNDPDLHLAVDNAEFHQVTNLQRVTNRVKKRSEPVLRADRPWEGDRAQAWGSVIQEANGLLRMWYFSLNTERRTNEVDR